MMWCLVKHKKH